MRQHFASKQKYFRSCYVYQHLILNIALTRKWTLIGVLRVNIVIVDSEINPTHIIKAAICEIWPKHNRTLATQFSLIYKTMLSLIASLSHRAFQVRCKLSKMHLNCCFFYLSTITCGLPEVNPQFPEEDVKVFHLSMLCPAILSVIPLTQSSSASL